MPFPGRTLAGLFPDRKPPSLFPDPEMANCCLCLGLLPHRKLPCLFPDPEMADSLPVLGRFSQTVPLHLSTPSSTLCPQRPQHLIKHQEHVLHAFCAFCLPEIPPELTPWCVDMSPSSEISSVERRVG